MTTAAPSAQRPITPGRAGLVWGLALLVPRLVLAWFLGLDAMQLLASFLLLAGLVLIGVWAFRRLLAARGGGSLWPFFLAGVAAVVLAGVITTAVGTTGAPVAYAAGAAIVPAPVVLHQYAWTAVGALWVIGLVFAIGAPLLALGHRRLAAVEQPLPPQRRR